MERNDSGLEEMGEIAKPRSPPFRNPGLAGLQVGDLVTLASDRASRLARKELELAKMELEQDLKQEGKMAAGLGLSALLGLQTLSLLLVAVVFALIETGLPGWASALIVAGATLLAGSTAAALGWSRRVKRPMSSTRRSLEESLRWAKGLR